MKHLLAAVVCLVLAGCATPYTEMGLLGGVEAQRVDDRTVRISARGNEYTDTATIKDYTILKAAETTLKSGFQLFGITSSADASKAGTYFTPGQAVNYVMPGQDLYIHMLNGNENPKGQKVSNAAEVKKHLGAK